MAYGVFACLCNFAIGIPLVLVSCFSIYSASMFLGATSLQDATCVYQPTYTCTSKTRKLCRGHKSNRKCTDYSFWQGTWARANYATNSTPTAAAGECVTRAKGFLPGPALDVLVGMPYVVSFADVESSNETSCQSDASNFTTSTHACILATSKLISTKYCFHPSWRSADAAMVNQFNKELLVKGVLGLVGGIVFVASMCWCKRRCKAEAVSAVAPEAPKPQGNYTEEEKTPLTAGGQASAAEPAGSSRTLMNCCSRSR